ncbi:MAG: hypothetical protein ACHQIG_10885 [Acidimicrobiia bacterium]
MRIFRLVIATTMACGLLLGVMGPAGAASTNCATLKSLQNKLDSIDTSGKNFKVSQFSGVGDAFHSAAKKAKRKLKSALNNLGDTYESIGSGNISDLQDLSSSRYTKSLKAFAKASVNCA